MTKPILAKSARGGRPGRTLLEHTEDVSCAARAMFGGAETPTRLAERWLRLFAVEDRGAFYRALEAAAVLHDLGKANGDFARMIEGSSDGQFLRHEHLTGVLMTYPPLRAWLETQTDVDWDVVLSAVTCHHLKCDMNEGFPRPAGGRDDGNLLLLSDHPDFSELLLRVKAAVGLTAEPPAVPSSWSWTPAADQQPLRRLERETLDRLAGLHASLRKDRPRRSLLRAVRAALIAADAVGSGVVREGETPADWVRQVFGAELCDGAYVEANIIRPRIEQLGTRWNGWDRFQDDAAELPPRALLLAPCGSGKTLAAWRWIARQAAEGVRHLLFLYPTRATATEGFRDYVSWAPEADAALMHGSAAYELEGIFANPDDGPGDHRAGKTFEADARLFALGYWRKRVFSATVDQFLAFLQYRYESLCLLPVLADAVVVIDEVHSFDRGMFSALKDFLTEFPTVPVLCMTATLPDRRRRELERCGLTVYGYDRQPEDLKRIADAPRYQVRRGSRGDAERLAEEALAAGRKVLWVANTVSRAQAIAARFAVSVHDARLETAAGAPVFCYHSRFRLADRKDRHAEVVTAFRIGAKGAALAVTTQVCEMGLDLDADVLITEEAPVTSLIQRMGRCNRAREPRDPRGSAGAIFVYSPGGGPEANRPYDAESLAGVGPFLDELATRETVNQTDLEEALRVVPAVREPPKACQFLQSGAYAAAGRDQFRDIEEFTTSAVLDSDVRLAIDLRRDKRPIDGLVFPVPSRFRTSAPQNPPELPRHLIVAPAKHYLPLLGFCDQPVAAGDPPPCLPPGPWIL
ncbi:MAG TPA: CRISPR-associated helicase Cas3' [Planctomycetaceae bacterium]